MPLLRFMTRKILYSVRSRLILAILVPLLPLVVLMSVMTISSHREQVQRVNEAAENYALVASGYQKEMIVDLRQLLSAMVEETEYRQGGEACQRSLNRILARINDYSAITVVDKNGKLLCGTGDTKQDDVSDREYFKQAKKTLQFTVSNELQGRISHKAIIVGAMPWVDQNGDFGGLITAGIENSRFAFAFKDMPLPPGSEYYVLDRSGVVLAGSNNEMSSELRARLGMLPVLTEKPLPFVMKDGDVAMTYTALSVENGALTIIIGIPRRFFFTFNAESLWIVLFGPFAMLILSIGLLWYFGNRLVSAPVAILMRTARAYSRGDLTVRPALERRSGELGELATTFADMADRITRREQELQDAIQKRELMLREIHHRVKNNLQIVISLVNLQSKSVSLPAAQEAFTEIQTRMRALALVHRYLYESDDLQSVNIGAFLTELASSLQMAYGISPSRVALETKVDAVYEVIDRAVPLALFMTETISNALRHGFPENRQGIVRVSLKALEGNQACFCVEDNGVGIEPDADSTNNDGIYRAPKPITGLGMSLAKAFARQVDGELTIGGPPGTIVTLLFKGKQLSPIDSSAS